MVTGLGIDSCICLCWMDVCSFAFCFLSCLLAWVAKGSSDNWQSSGAVRCLCWGLLVLGCLCLAWPPVKPKSSSEVEDQNMEPIEGGALLLTVAGWTCICVAHWSPGWWCGLYLCLWGLPELQERAGHGEDDEVGGTGQQSGPWGSGI